MSRMGAVIVFVLVMNLGIGLVSFVFGHSLGLPTPGVRYETAESLNDSYAGKTYATQEFETINPLTFGVDLIVKAFSFFFQVVWNSTLGAYKMYYDLFMLLPNAESDVALAFTLIVSTIQNAIMFFGLMEFIGRYTGT